VSTDFNDLNPGGKLTSITLGTMVMSVGGIVINGVVETIPVAATPERAFGGNGSALECKIELPTSGQSPGSSRSCGATLGGFAGLTSYTVFFRAKRVGFSFVGGDFSESRVVVAAGGASATLFEDKSGNFWRFRSANATPEVETAVAKTEWIEFMATWDSATETITVTAGGSTNSFPCTVGSAPTELNIQMYRYDATYPGPLPAENFQDDLVIDDLYVNLEGS
jgi:hypothetical protein